MKEVVFPHLGRTSFGKLPASDPPLEFVEDQVLREARNRVVFRGLSLDQFLKLPEAKPALEFLDRKAVQKMSPGLICSQAQRSGGIYLELRTTFGGRSLVPDLAFFRKGQLPRDRCGRLLDDVFLPPDLVIEVLSRGEPVRCLSFKLKFCTSHGVRLAWLIQPTRRRVFVFRPERPVEILEGPAILSGQDVLPGFTLPLEELFGWLQADD